MSFKTINPFVLDIEIDDQGAIKNIKELSTYFQLYDYRNVLYNRFEKDKYKTIDDMFNSQLFYELLPRESNYIDPIWKKNPNLTNWFSRNFVHTLKYTILYRRENFCDEHDFIILNYYPCTLDSFDNTIKQVKAHGIFNKKIMFTKYSEETLIDKLFEKELSIKDLIKLNNNYILIHHVYRGYPDYIDIKKLIEHYKKYKFLRHAEEQSYQSTINCKYYFDSEKFCNEKTLSKYQDSYLDGYLQSLLKHNPNFFNHIEFVVPNDVHGLRFIKRRRIKNKFIIYDTATTSSGTQYHLCQRQSDTFYISNYT